MTLSVEDRLAALRNRLQKRAEAADDLLPIDIPPAAPSLSEMIKRIQMNVHAMVEGGQITAPQLDDASQ